MRLLGRNEESITEWIWKPHNEATGQRMYDLCVDLRGFYLKAEASYEMHGSDADILRAVSFWAHEQTSFLKRYALSYPGCMIK